MSAHARRRFITAALAAVTCLVIRSTAAAFSIGALEIHALAPGEPLNARVPLFFETYENPQAPLHAALLEADDYPRHAPPPPFLDAITVERAGNVLRLYTATALPRNALDNLPADGWGLLMRVARADGAAIIHIYRLHPPVATPAGIIPPPGPPVPPEPEPTPVTPSRRPRLQPGEAAYGPVEKGQSLYRIAARLGFRGADTWLAAYALWQRNAASGAFVRNNIHGLRAGAVLAVPTDLARRVTSYDPAVVQSLAARHRRAWHDAQTLPAPAGVPGPRPLRTSLDPDPVTAAQAHTPPPTATPMRFPVQSFPAAAPKTPQPEPAPQPPAETIPQPASLPRATPAPAPNAPPPATPPDTPHGLITALRPLDAYLTTHVGSTHLHLSPTADPAERAGAAVLLAAGAACLLASAVVRTRRRYRRQRRQNQPEP